jgi:hypothetical protein
MGYERLPVQAVCEAPVKLRASVWAAMAEFHALVKVSAICSATVATI